MARRREPRDARLEKSEAGQDVAARRLLLRFLVRNRISYHAAAEALGVKHPAVFQWVKGPNRPRNHRVRIESWTDGEVPASAWLRKGETVDGAVPAFVQTGTEG